MSKVVIRGHEFEFDGLDLDALSTYSDAEKNIRSVLESVNSLAENPNLDDLTTVFKGLVAYFDKVLGKGSLMKVLDGKRNLGEALDAYYDLRDSVLAENTTKAAEIAKRAQVPDAFKSVRK